VTGVWTHGSQQINKEYHPFCSFRRFTGGLAQVVRLLLLCFAIDPHVVLVDQRSAVIVTCPHWVCELLVCQSQQHVFH
jgi:hypothetical protein